MNKMAKEEDNKINNSAQQTQQTLKKTRRKSETMDNSLSSCRSKFVISNALEYDYNMDAGNKLFYNNIKIEEEEIKKETNLILMDVKNKVVIFSNMLGKRIKVEAR